MAQPPTLYLMLGYPGAGKTTTAECIAKLTGAVVLTSDRIRLELFPRPQFTSEEHQALYQAIDQRAEALLAEGKSVIYDANLNRYVHRQEKYDICKRTAAKTILVWVQTKPGTAKKRALHLSRSHLWSPQEKPQQMFDRIVEIFEPPTPQEAYIAVDGTKITPTYVAKKLEEVGLIS